MKRTELKRKPFNRKPNNNKSKPKAQRKEPQKEYTPMLNDSCYFTHRKDWLEVHHLMGGSNRDKSEQYGLKVYLNHWYHNEPPLGVHHNEERMFELHCYAQQVFEERYPELDFCEVFQCPNYLALKED
jgi:hypothetical protein